MSEEVLEKDTCSGSWGGMEQPFWTPTGVLQGGLEMLNFPIRVIKVIADPGY